jgi:ADP-ribosylglycohydrolase
MSDKPHQPAGTHQPPSRVRGASAAAGDVRVSLAELSLTGLSVGDAFGEGFFINPAMVESLIAQRAFPKPRWRITDDTVMGASVIEVLRDFARIDQNALADRFARRYQMDDGRGYGPTAHDILQDLCRGIDWRTAAGRAFGGTGSMGNGGAMRAGPIGGYFFDDLGRAAVEARLSAEVTHAHPEGQAGAIAVAVAAAWAVDPTADSASMFEAVLAHVPAGETRSGIERAARLPKNADVPVAVAELGNGSRVISQDTVPFALWCVARHLGDFEESLWTTVAGLGDRDTTCAIVGSIVALSPGATIPATWIEAREPLEVIELEN